MLIMSGADTVLHNPAATKQWTTKWPYIANAVRIVQCYGD